MVFPGCQPSPGRQQAVAHSGWGAVRVLRGRGAGLAPRILDLPLQRTLTELN